MSAILDQERVLVLNKHWVPVNSKTLKDAFVDLTSEPDAPGKKPYMAMDMEFDGDWVLVSARPVLWAEWITLPLRGYDIPIQCAHDRVIRAPTVIVASNYDKTPLRKQPFSPMAIKRRDRYQCQYCRKLFPVEQLNLDHVLPKSRGGETVWNNIVCSCIKCNSKKGNRLNHEVGYVPLNEPVEPRHAPVVSRFYNVKHPSWMPFLPRT